MNYTIMYARKGTYCLFYEKSGNMYLVGDYDTVTNKSTFREEYDLSDDASDRFLELCHEKGMKPQSVKHDPSDFNFD